MPQMSPILWMAMVFLLILNLSVSSTSIPKVKSHSVSSGSMAKSEKQFKW